jgi:hypothetical protein
LARERNREGHGDKEHREERAAHGLPPGRVA